jgi:hypothetical protein
VTYIVRRDCIRRHWGGCSDNGIAVPGTSRCRAHTDKGGWNKYALRHPERAQYYRSPHWQARRAEQIRKYPNCQWPGCQLPARHADHVVALGLGGSLEGPLQSLCAEHHKAKTLADSHEGMKRAAARRRGNHG